MARKRRATKYTPLPGEGYAPTATEAITGNQTVPDLYREPIVRHIKLPGADTVGEGTYGNAVTGEQTYPLPLIREEAAGQPSLAQLGLPQFQGPQQADYLAAFNQALAEQRAAIERDFQRALAEIARQETIGQEALRRFPGSLQQIYGSAQQQAQQYAQTLQEAQAKAGLQPLVGAEAQLAPIKAAIQAAQASRLADVGYLQQGLVDLFTRRRGAAEAVRSELMRALEQQRAAAALEAARRQQELAQRRAELEYEARLRDYFMGREAQLRDLLEQRQLERQLSLAQLGLGRGGAARRPTELELRLQALTGSSSINPERVLAMEPEERDKIRTTQTYQRLTNIIAAQRQQGADDATILNLLLTDPALSQVIRKRPRATALALFDQDVRFVSNR